MLKRNAANAANNAFRGAGCAAGIEDVERVIKADADECLEQSPSASANRRRGGQAGGPGFDQETG